MANKPKHWARLNPHSSTQYAHMHAHAHMYGQADPQRRANANVCSLWNFRGKSEFGQK